MRLRYLAFLALACVAATPTHPVRTVLALMHVTVIDATAAAAKPDMTVIISDGRITEIGTSPKIHPPGNAQIIDAANKFLIPGLWDMHVTGETPTSFRFFSRTASLASASCGALALTL